MWRWGGKLDGLPEDVDTCESTSISREKKGRGEGGRARTFADGKLVFRPLWMGYRVVCIWKRGSARSVAGSSRGHAAPAVGGRISIHAGGFRSALRLCFRRVVYRGKMLLRRSSILFSRAS